MIHPSNASAGTAHNRENAGLNGFWRHHGQSIQAMANFGLTKADVLRDLGFIFDHYGFNREG